MTGVMEWGAGVVQGPLTGRFTGRKRVPFHGPLTGTRDLDPLTGRF